MPEQKENHDVQGSLARLLDELALFYENATPRSFGIIKEIEDYFGRIRSGELIVVAGPDTDDLDRVFSQSMVFDASQSMATGKIEIDRHPRDFPTDLLANQGRVELDRIRHGALEDADWYRISGTVGSLTDRSIWISQETRASVDQLVDRIRDAKASCPDMAMVAVDNIRSITSSDSWRPTHFETIARELKAAAVELDLAIVLQAPVPSITKDNAKSWVTTSHFIGHMASVPAFADRLILLNHDWYFRRLRDTKDAMPGDLTVTMDKNLHGPTGSVKMVLQRGYATVSPALVTTDRLDAMENAVGGSTGETDGVENEPAP